MNSAPVRRDRTLPVLLAVLGLLVVVALAVVFTRGEVKLLDASTPGGVVQRYAAAAIEGDEEAAAAYLAEPAEPCDEFYETTGDNRRISLVSTRERGTTAEVEVSIVTFEAGGPFGSSEYEFKDHFGLVREDGDWLIDQVPWQLRICGGTGTR
ncbi:hypothetical protein ACX80W_10520 [Arthrobacter sp. TMN-37]